MLDNRLVPPEGATLNDLVWEGPQGVRALRSMMMAMLFRCKSGPPDLLRSWSEPPGRRGGTRGLTQREFTERIKDMCLDEHEDLWENEILPAVNAAFQEIMRLKTGENFLRKIEILHLERWLATKMESVRQEAAISGRAPQSVLAHRIVDRQVAQLQRKTHADFKRQLRRRRIAEEERKPRVPPNVDWVEMARGQIASYSGLPLERAIAQPPPPQALSASLRARMGRPTPMEVIGEWRRMKQSWKKHMPLKRRNLLLAPASAIMPPLPRVLPHSARGPGNGSRHLFHAVHESPKMPGRAGRAGPAQNEIFR